MLECMAELCDFDEMLFVVNLLVFGLCGLDEMLCVVSVRAVWLGRDVVRC